MRFSEFSIPFLTASVLHLCVLFASPGDLFDGGSVGAAEPTVRLRVISPVLPLKVSALEKESGKREMGEETASDKVDFGKKKKGTISASPSSEMGTDVEKAGMGKKERQRPTGEGGQKADMALKGGRESMEVSSIDEVVMDGTVAGRLDEEEGIAPVKDERVKERAERKRDDGGAGVFSPPLIAFVPEPEYPDYSRRHGEEGVVMLRVAIDEKGDGDNIEILRSSGYKHLDRAAVLALEKARFYPARKGGMPVSSVKKIAVRFDLEDHE